MVKYKYDLDALFMSLGDPTRRDILQRLALEPMTVGEIAAKYNVSLPAISKHLTYLERSRLVTRRRSGRTHTISIDMQAMQAASAYLEVFINDWDSRVNRLKSFLEETK